MRLASLKIAGFKSFADPVSLHFPDALTAIVGPNGCGKSNVMDAIRWVMGESSARQLRGEAHPAVQVRNCNLALAQGTGGNLATRHCSATLILERE